MSEASASEPDDRFLDSIVEWAERRSDIVALIMTGSRARPHGIVDGFSDYDLEIFTGEPSLYTSGDGWMREIDDVLVYLPTISARGCETRLVVFDGGRKVDFSIWPADVLERIVESQALADIYERGFRVLLDRTGLASRLPAPSYSPPARQLPVEAQFRALVEEFWFETSQIPKYIERDDLWVVKYRDWTMKTLLLRMVEWQVVASGRGDDIWQIGTRMKDWAGPEVWRRVHDAFGRYDAADSRRALLATIALFRDVATDTALLLGFQYPQETDNAISGYIGMFEERD